MQISGDNSKYFLVLVVFLNWELVNLAGKLSSPSKKIQQRKYTEENDHNCYQYNTITNDVSISIHKQILLQL